MSKKKRAPKPQPAKVKKKKKVGAPNAYNPAIMGILDIAPHGMGFVAVEGMTQDIKIDKGTLGNALPGDEVEVVITRIGRASNRAHGRIKRINKRAKHIITGTMDVSVNYAFCVPTNQAYQKDIFIPKLPKGLKNGDRVVVEITDWEDKNKNPQGKIIEVFTGEDMHDIAMKEILLEYGFPLTFPDEVLAETEKMAFAMTDADLKERRDMRDALTITIDPVDAKDFDDAISYKDLGGGKIEIGVHIADVSHYVKEGTALDKEAYARATSVYLPDRVLPMLPEKISNELCSLRPHEDKFTFSAVFIMDKKNKIIDTWIGRTIIHSDHRFTYEDVQVMLEGGEGKHKETIQALYAVSKDYRERRFRNDAINFSSEEVRFKLDEDGTPIEVIVKVSQESHQLVEEMMLLANRTVSEYINKEQQGKEKIAFPYRVHDSPDIEKLLPFTKYAGKFGYTFDLQDKHTIAKSFNTMLSESLKHPEQHVLHALGIRTMAKAVYTTKNIGHYGLGFEHYAHFTSPIRRYPDIIAHRVIWNQLNKLKQTFTLQRKAEEQCVHCSKQERNAMEAERASNKYKQVQFMQQHVGEEFDAVISGVGKFGFWCETIAHLCEGFVSVRDMKEEFKFDEDNYLLTGTISKKSFTIGQQVKILVAGANLTKRQLDYELVEH